MTSMKASFNGVCVAFMVILHTSVSQEARYDGHKVYRLVPETRVQLDKIQGLLEDHPHVDVWQEPSLVGRPVDVMLDPEHKYNLLKTLFDNGIKHGVLIPDVQNLIMQHTLINDLIKGSHRENMWSSYHNLPEITTWLKQKAVQCGPRCSIVSMGKSFEGRDLNLIKITGKESYHGKQSVWLDAGIHAREWIGPAVATYIIDRLIDGYGSDPDVTAMVDAFDWYILPVLNVDGYAYTWDKDRNWRKTRSRNSSVPECVGVDANRNYNFKWDTVGSSSNPCSNIFAGHEALSEPEARAQSDFMLNSTANWRVFLTLHSFGQLWMAPWGYTTEPPDNYEQMMEAGETAVKALEAVHGTPYTLGSASSILYTSSGTSRDWAKGVPNIEYVYTVELRDNGVHAFMLPPSQIRPTAEETWEGVKALLLYIMSL